MENGAVIYDGRLLFPDGTRTQLMEGDKLTIVSTGKSGLFITVSRGQGQKQGSLIFPKLPSSKPRGLSRHDVEQWVGVIANLAGLTLRRTGESTFLVKPPALLEVLKTPFLELMMHGLPYRAANILYLRQNYYFGDVVMRPKSYFRELPGIGKKSLSALEEALGHFSLAVGMTLAESIRYPYLDWRKEK